MHRVAERAQLGRVVQQRADDHAAQPLALVIEGKAPVGHEVMRTKVQEEISRGAKTKRSRTDSEFTMM